MLELFASFGDQQRPRSNRSTYLLLQFGSMLQDIQWHSEFSFNTLEPALISCNSKTDRQTDRHDFHHSHKSQASNYSFLYPFCDLLSLSKALFHLGRYNEARCTAGLVLQSLLKLYLQYFKLVWNSHVYYYIRRILYMVCIHIKNALWYCTISEPFTGRSKNYTQMCTHTHTHAHLYILHTLLEPVSKVGHTLASKIIASSNFFQRWPGDPRL